MAVQTFPSRFVPCWVPAHYLISCILIGPTLWVYIDEFVLKGLLDFSLVLDALINQMDSC